MATPRRARVEATGERAAVTPLELFSDLVFVFTITQITDLMAEDPTVVHVIRGVLVLGGLWWIWGGYAWLGNIARADEGVIRVAMFAAMGGLFVAAITAKVPVSLPIIAAMLLGLGSTACRWRPSTAARRCISSRTSGSSTSSWAS